MISDINATSRRFGKGRKSGLVLVSLLAEAMQQIP
jgi:hypothetical protein